MESEGKKVSETLVDVPVEDLGEGIVNALGSLVGGVVAISQSYIAIVMNKINLLMTPDMAEDGEETLSEDFVQETVLVEESPPVEETILVEESLPVEEADLPPQSVPVSKTILVAESAPAESSAVMRESAIREEKPASASLGKLDGEAYVGKPVKV